MKPQSFLLQNYRNIGNIPICLECSRHNSAQMQGCGFIVLRESLQKTRRFLAPRVHVTGQSPSNTKILEKISHGNSPQLSHFFTKLTPSLFLRLAPMLGAVTMIKAQFIPTEERADYQASLRVVRSQLPTFSLCYTHMRTCTLHSNQLRTLLA